MITNKAFKTLQHLTNISKGEKKHMHSENEEKPKGYDPL